MSCPLHCEEWINAHVDNCHTASRWEDVNGLAVCYVPGSFVMIQVEMVRLLKVSGRQQTIVVEFGGWRKGRDKLRLEYAFVDQT